MSYIDDFIKRAKEETARQIAKAEQHRVLEPIMSQLITQWNKMGRILPFTEDTLSPADTTISFSYTSIDCCCVNFHLASSESLKGPRVEAVLNNMLDNPQLHFLSQTDYAAMHWIAWRFIHFNGSVLMLRFWTYKSKLCRYVPTGKKIDELNLVCEDTE